MHMYIYIYIDVYANCHYVPGAGARGPAAPGEPGAEAPVEFYNSYETGL